MVGTKTPKHLRKAALAALLVVLGSAASARAQLQHFNPGSLIIPMESPFQDPCGVVSAYGLIYKVLAASDQLATKPGKGRVTVHWVYKDTKASPNRCVPTNLNKNPQTPASCPAPYSDPKKCQTLPYLDKNWNDGCDFAVTSTLVTPVTQIDNTNSSNTSSGDLTTATCSSTKGVFCTRNTTSGADAQLVYPTFPSVTVQHSATASLNVTTVQYMGGAFVIDATDAPVFRQLLSGALQVPDSFGVNIDFSTFAKKTDIGACAYSFDGSATTFTSGFANTHWVNIHRAAVGFDATDSRQMNSTPAKIALLQTAGGKEGVGTNGVIGDMLPNYLKSAGLNFTGAQGCSPTGYNAKQVTGATSTNCPLGKKSGYIFDAFDVLDLQTLGELNQTYVDSTGQTKFVYQNFWTPHWEGTTFTVPAVGTQPAVNCDAACINKARQTIIDFTKTRKVGLLAECGSVAVIEGSQGANAFDSSAPGDIQLGSPAAGWWYPPKPQTSPGVYADPAGGFVVGPTSNAGEPPTRLMTCVETTPGSGVCSNPPSNTGTAGMRGTLHDIDPKGPTSNTANYSIIGKSRLRNCTDPDLASSVPCMYYTASGTAYSQLGDYLWFSRYGLLSNFKPNTGNAYSSNVTPLGYTIASVNKPGPSLDYQTARAQGMADDFNFMLQPIGASKLNASQIVYLGGHSYAADVSGTRVVLNTMLALGVVPDSAETGYIGATEYNGNAFVPTYMRITTPGAPAQWRTFMPSMADQWQFPYHTGHFRAHPVSGTGALAANAVNGYTDALAFNNADAADNGVINPAKKTLPSAGVRNIFTYLGGSISTGSGPNNVLQKGWQAVDIDYPSVDPSTGCVDKFHIGEINSTTKPNYSGPPYAGMLPGGDGVCDLQEAFELTNITTQIGSDHGTANGVSGGSIPTAFLGDLLNAKEFAQMIRGYCYATKADGSFQDHPTSNLVCNAYNDGFSAIQNDTPDLGGFVHSQAAIVPASQFIADVPTGTHRPTVAYLGGLDGMLHAFYVPSDGFDLGYTGPALQTGTTKAVPSYNPDASSTFTGHTAYGSFTYTTANALQELWAFVPPGQLPLLQANNAVVDSSPVVIDAYGDFDGSGIRTWHTVLVASAGGNNRELFALDVTNPLKPVLLWDLQASFEDQAGLLYAPASLADDDTGLDTTSQAQAFAWQNGCHAGAANCTISDFVLPPIPTGVTPPKLTGLYNFANLGASQSISVAQMRRFNSPLFAAFVATNEPQNKADMGSGVFVFAIDVTTGQKVWEFNNPYNLSDDPQIQVNGIGNTPPAGVTLFSKTGNSIIDTAYVGDDEGALWELDAADGLNVNSFRPFRGVLPATTCASGQQCNFALSEAFGYEPGLTRGSLPPQPPDTSAQPQPISSLSTVFILPSGLTGPLAAFAGQPMLAYGTAGTDTVSGLEPAADPTTGATCADPLNPCISGAVHLVPLLPGFHFNVNDLKQDLSKLAHITQQGVVQAEPNAMPLGFPHFFDKSERVYGSIVAAGDQLFFNTTTGSVSQIDARGNLGGASYRLLLSAASNQLYNYVKELGLTNSGGAGGTPMLDSTTGTLVVVTDKGILRLDAPPTKGTLVGASVNGRGATPSGLLSWYFRRRGLEY
jgi:hypothetical protein